MRELNLGRPEKYNVFWEYCQKFLDGAVKNSVDSLLAVDERRHDTIVHLAKAISVKIYAIKLLQFVQKIHQYLMSNGSIFNSGQKIPEITQVSNILVVCK